MSVSNEFAQVIKSYAAFVNDGKKLDTVFYDGMFNLGFAADTFMYRTDMVWPTEDQMEMHNILKLAQMNNVLLKSDMAAEDDILDRVDEETEIGELKGIKWAYGDEPHLVEFQIYNEGGSIRKYNMTHPGREYDSEGHLIPLPGSEASGKEGAAVEEIASEAVTQAGSAVEEVSSDVASAVEEVSSEVDDMMEESVIEEVSEDVLEAGEAVSSLDAIVSDRQNGSLDFSASGNVNLESDIEKHLDFDESLLDEPDDSIFNLSESASFEFDESEDSFDSEDNFEVEEPEIEAPVVEAVAEPVVEAVAEPVVEAVAEPVVEAATEPVVEAVTEPAVESVAQMNSSELENALALAKGKIAELSEKVKDYDFLLGKVSDLTAKVTSLESYKSQAEDKIHSLEEKLSAATGKHKELEEKLLSVSKQAEDAKNQAVSQVKELAKAQAKTQKEEFTKKMSQMKEMLSAMENQFFSNVDE